ncbi:MAG: DNA lyase [Deltaproteobacteria bacterium]|nr:DNA lyase [Deltaproteobacteria bacterium]
MKAVCTEQLDSAIGALCPEIWGNMQSISKTDHSESKLWEELVCCLLSSQVKFELSQAVTENIKRNGFLDLKVIDSSYEDRLREILRSQVKIDNRAVKYRFPNAKAKQIATARDNIYGSGISLQKILGEYSDPSELRIALVNLVPGLGMKQASMYLRNVSNSFELAVIDVHVLRYMNVLNLVKKIPSTISKAQYLVKENMLTKYAEKFGYPVGCVDYAIWIVMRVARKDGYL